MRLSRRGFAGGLVSLTLCASPAFGQWPNGARSDPLPPDPDAALRGCLIGSPSDIKYTWMGEGKAEELVDKLFDWLSAYLTVFDGVVVVFDGPDSYNAFATPRDLVMNRKDGMVLIGRSLIDHHKKAFGGRWASALATSIAHESGHLAQYKLGLHLPTRIAELHADYLAGWSLHRLGRRRELGKYTDAGIARESLRSLQSGSQGATTHGSAEERVRSFDAGWQYADDHQGRGELGYVPAFEGLQFLGFDGT